MKSSELKQKLDTSKFLETYEPQALLETVEGILKDNTSRDELLDALNDFREGLDEDSEDMVLDVMDRLVGFCAPDKQI